MIRIENEKLTISINAKGAELHSIENKELTLEYLWGGDPEYWGKHAPVLFPIVGTLKEDTYYFEGKAYNLSRHGFAREMKFDTLSHDNTKASFELKSNSETKEAFPFEFVLRIHYSLEGNKLVNKYEVVNNDEKTLYFSIGGHPAFNVPLQEGSTYNDYYLEFDTAETVPRWPLHDGLIRTQPEDFLHNERKIYLSHNLFAKDAIVLKHLKSKTVSLRSGASKHGLTMTIEGFPYLGIWAAPEAPFVCIEPWCGIADSLHHNQQLVSKEGIIVLETGNSWTKAWDVSFF
jgi:galactose mutarotase-like enzyme